LFQIVQASSMVRIVSLIVDVTERILLSKLKHKTAYVGHT